MRLWSIQTIEHWREFERKGWLRSYVPDPDYSLLYEWMRQETAKRVGPPPVNGCYPVWAWYQWLGQDKRRPDLRSSGHVKRGRSAVRVEIELPSNRILLSDYDLWHHPLNCSPIFESDQQSDAFYAEVQQAGFPQQPWDWDILASILKHPVFGPFIRTTWEKIFDLSWHCEDLTEPLEKKSIQATFWEIRKEDVRAVEYFKAR